MSISSVSFGNTPYSQGIQSNQSSAFQQRKQDVSALQSALNSGDLAGAQKAFASLQQDMQTMRQGQSGQGADQDGNGSATSQAGQNSFQTLLDQRKQDFTTLQNALSSGDLKGAQQAFASLQQDTQNIRQGHHHHHHGGGNVQAAAASPDTSSAGSTNTPSGGTNIDVAA